VARGDGLVISAYPLTDEFRSKLGQSVPERLEFTTAAALRAEGFRAMLMRQWSSRFQRVFIASQVDEAQAFTPLIACVALGFRWPRVTLVDPQLRLSDLSTPEIFLGGAGVLIASTDAALARLTTWRARHSLADKPRTPDPVIRGSWSGQRVLYLKNMMWFGAQAGGSVGHVAGVVNALDLAGAKVSIVSSTDTPMLNAGVRQVRPPRLGVLGLPTQANVFRMQHRARATALAEARRIGATLIYQRLTLGDFTGAVVARELGVPLVVEYNGSEVWCLRNWGDGVRYRRHFEAAEELMLSRANYVFTISEVLYDELAGRGLPAHRIGWYPNGVDPQVFDPARFPEVDRRALRAQLGLSDDDRVAAFVGTFGDWHGADIMARAAVQLARRSSSAGTARLRFLFIGDGRNRGRCERIVAGTPAEHLCHFMGLIPQHATPAYLAISDVLVSPHVPNPDGTRFFGSPTKLFEYMSMGKPIVASALGQIAAVLRDGATALLVEPGDVDGLAAGLERIMENRELAAELGRNARREAIGRYSWAKHVEVMRAGIERIDVD
jgi:glycosyltransferase involved in cell wall biosynthesis